MVDVRRAAERGTSTAPRLTSRHSFSFGAFYDPSNVALSVLVAHNDDVVGAGGGYDTHPHADTEIVTWLVEGSLRHEDSEAGTHLLLPGQVQLLSAGRGVRHSEHSAEQGAGATRFVQMWLRPDESGLPPRYARGDVADAGPDRLVPLVSGRADVDAPVRIHTAGAALHVTRLGDGGSVRLPDAPHVHLFVVRGAVDLEGAGRLGEGDAARFTADGSRRLTGRPHPDSSAVTPRGSPAFPQTNRGGAEVLVWELP